MSQDNHAPFIENIPAYALGALDVDDIAALEAHLRTCASCQTELAEYRALSASLLTATPPKQPSAALRKRLQSRLPSARKVSRPQFAWSFSRLAMGLVVVVLLALNLLSFMQLRQIQNQQAVLLRQVEDSQVALALLSSPDTQMLSIAGETASGKILLDRQSNMAVLIAEHVPQLEQNQTYQIWLVSSNGDRTSAGLFRPESGQLYTAKAIAPTQMFSDYVGIGVTVEPAGGSDHPTGKRLFKVDF
jgi:anti-sigma-K factor RskA